MKMNNVHVYVVMIIGSFCHRYLTNRDIQDANFYFSDAPKTADGILKAFQAKDTLHFFENAGLLMKEREGGQIGRAHV